MAAKLIPKLQQGAALSNQQAYSQQLMAMFNATKQKQTTVDMGDMLSTWKPEGGTMPAIKPIGLTQLPQPVGSVTPQDFKTLKPMTISQAPGTGMSAGTAGAIASGVASLGTAGIDAFSKTPEGDEFGNAKLENKGATVGKSTLKGAATGASLGLAVGGPFAPITGAIGGVLGGAIGFFKGKKDAEANDKQYEQAHSNSYGNFYGNQYASQFQAMKGKDGMKLKTAHVITQFTDKDRLVPRYKKGGSINVIVSGKLHKENNSLGNKDKGIPVITAEGEKKFELEKEELILNLEASKQVEKLVNNYNTKHDDVILEDLGRFVQSELLKNTKDNSKKFGLEV